MKIVFSRKGFDSGSGGCPSPIGPNNEMVSLPIPGGSPHRYRNLETRLGSMSDLVRNLTRDRMRGSEPAHLDPDLDASLLPRQPGWLPALGQVGAAQSHLEGQGVGPGDLMLFFGWFRPVEEREGVWKYRPGQESIHACFGYLQIGESLRIGPSPDTAAILKERPWLEGHPHVTGARSANNTIHIASEELIIDGRRTGLPGGGNFPIYHPELMLTAPNSPKSRWKVPSWLSPHEGGPGLSYHGDTQRWSSDDQGNALLQTVAKGQEFVADLAGIPAAGAWIERMVRYGLGKDLAPEAASVRTRAPR